MNRLNVEDFYNWQPMVEMAGTILSTLDSINNTVRLTAKLDFHDETIDYVVTFRDSYGIYCMEYDRLEDAVYCYNKKLEENNYGTDA